jgi:hypothetical protein
MPNVLALVVLAAALPTAAASTSRVRGFSPSDTAVIAQAVDRARWRLGQPVCQGLFRDFSDETGTTLEARLAAQGLTPQGALDQVLFYDGSAQPLCTKDILAFTAPGSHVVLVCAARFVDPHNGHLRSAIVIHELLHALGLGEGGLFPSSGQITTDVRWRCG